MARDSEKYRYIVPPFETPFESQGLVTSSLPYFQPSPRISSFRPFHHPRPILEERITRGMRWAEKRDRGRVSGTTPAINTVMTLASLPPSRCYYAKRFAVLCHREYAGILEPSLNPIHRASAFIEPSPLRLSLFSLFFRSVEANGPSPRSSRSYYYCI